MESGKQNPSDGLPFTTFQFENGLKWSLERAGRSERNPKSEIRKLGLWSKNAVTDHELRLSKKPCFGGVHRLGFAALLMALTVELPRYRAEPKALR